MSANTDENENKLYQNNIRLNKVKHVRLLIARAVNQFNQNRIDYKDLRAVGYVAGKLLEAFEKIEFEERLNELEKILDEKK